MLEFFLKKTLEDSVPEKFCYCWPKNETLDICLNYVNDNIFFYRLPKSVFDVSKKMLTEYSRNPLAATVEKEAGWLLLASLIASMPKEVVINQFWKFYFLRVFFDYNIFLNK